MAKVLLIEDDVELLRQLATRFRDSGHEVEVAADGEIGLRKLSTSRFDLVVTDIVMPVREGVETIMAIKQLAPQQKIIAISGGYRSSPTDFLSLARHLGADEVLAKPFRAAALLELAEQVIRRPDEPTPVAA